MENILPIKSPGKILRHLQEAFPAKNFPPRLQMGNREILLFTEGYPIEYPTISSQHLRLMYLEI